MDNSDKPKRGIDEENQAENDSSKQSIKKTDRRPSSGKGSNKKKPLGSSNYIKHGHISDFFKPATAETEKKIVIKTTRSIASFFQAPTPGASEKKRDGEDHVGHEEQSMLPKSSV